MTLEEFKDIHQNDTPVKKLIAFARETMFLGDSRVSRMEASQRRNNSDVSYYDGEIRAHDERAEWLFKELCKVLEPGMFRYDKVETDGPREAT